MFGEIRDLNTGLQQLFPIWFSAPLMQELLLKNILKEIYLPAVNHS